MDAETDLEVCGQAEDAPAARRLVERECPDVMLVDLSLGGASGLGLIRELVGRSVRALVVSMNDELTRTGRALAAGALGFVHEGEATKHAVEAIHRVLRRRPYPSERPRTG
jgi:DNA-binding NarL/FixJ family response regulator